MSSTTLAPPDMAFLLRIYYQPVCRSQGIPDAVLDDVIARIDYDRLAIESRGNVAHHKMLLQRAVERGLKSWQRDQEDLAFRLKSSDYSHLGC